MDKDYWNSRYRNGYNSGYGSYGEQLEKKLSLIRHLKDIYFICEIGCGDFNFGKNLITTFGSTSYSGFDISGEIIEKNKELYPNYSFETLPHHIPKSSDLLVCVDVLFHITDENELEKLLQTLEKSWNKYLIVTAYERDEEMNNHVRIRKFDYKRFGEPIIREIVEEDGELYFYVFKKD